MALDVGGIFASLGGRFDDRGFRMFDTAASSSTAKAARLGTVGTQAMEKIATAATVTGHRVERAFAGAEGAGVRASRRIGDESVSSARRSEVAWTGAADRIGRFTTRAVQGIGLVGGVTAALGIRFDALRQSSELAFGTLLHDAAAGKAMVADLYNFARVTPFSTPGVVRAAQQLLAYGFEAQQIKPMLVDIGDAAAAMGDLSAEHIERITRALGQIHTQGVLHQEELNQLTEAGIKASQYVAEAYGVSVNDLRKLVATGQIEGDKAIHAIREGIERDMGGAMDTLSHGFTGLLSNLTDTGQQIAGRVFRPLFDQLNEWMQEINGRLSSGELDGLIGRWQRRVQAFSDSASEGARWVERHWDDLSSAAEGLGHAVAGLVRLGAGMIAFLDRIGALSDSGVSTIVALAVGVYGATRAFQGLSAAVKAAQYVQALFNAEARANPYVLIASLIIGVVAALVTLYQTNERFRRIVNGVWREVAATVRQGAQEIRDAIHWVGEKLQWLWDKWEAIPAPLRALTPLGQAEFGIRAAGWLYHQTTAATGKRLDRPHIVVAGEEAPAHPEFFVSTNPRDRGRSKALVRELVEGYLGGRVEFMAGGGIAGGVGMSNFVGGGGTGVPSQPRYPAPDPNRRNVRDQWGNLPAWGTPAPPPTAAERMAEFRRVSSLLPEQPWQLLQPGGFGAQRVFPSLAQHIDFAGGRTPAPWSVATTPGITHQTLVDRFVSATDRTRQAYQMDMARLDNQLGLAQQTPSETDDRRVQRDAIDRMRRRITELSGEIATAPDAKTKLTLMQERATIQQQIGSTVQGLRRDTTAALTPSTFLTARQTFQLAEATRTHDFAAVRRLTQVDITRTRAAMQRAAGRGDFTTAATLSGQLATLEQTLKGQEQSGQPYLDQLRSEAAELLSPGASFTAEARGHRLRGGDLAARAAGVHIEVNTLHPASPRVSAKIARAWAGAVRPPAPRRARPAM